MHLRFDRTFTTGFSGDIRSNLHPVDDGCHGLLQVRLSSDGSHLGDELYRVNLACAKTFVSARRHEYRQALGLCRTLLENSRRDAFDAYQPRLPSIWETRPESEEI